MEGHDQLDDADVRAIARLASGRPDATPGPWEVTDISRSGATGSTASLHRLRGTVVADGTSVPWSAIRKVLQPHRLGRQVPSALRAAAAADVTYRHEADLYRAGIEDLMPPGLRLPEVHRIVELGEGRVEVWMEDVAVDAAATWDLDRHRRAAHALGRLAGRLTGAEGRLPRSFSRTPGAVLRMQMAERTALVAPLLADRTWSDPVLAAMARPGLRRDLETLLARLPALVDRASRLPQTFVHGDACPQNLLVAAAGAELVAIDWSLVGLSPVGYDLAQLVVGHAHAGLLAVGELPALRRAVIAAHRAGLAAEGLEVSEDEVALGLDVTLVVRSALSSVPLDVLEGPLDDRAAAHLATRLELTASIVEVGLAMATDGRIGP